MDRSQPWPRQEDRLAEVDLKPPFTADRLDDLLKRAADEALARCGLPLRDLQHMRRVMGFALSAALSAALENPGSAYRCAVALPEHGTLWLMVRWSVSHGRIRVLILRNDT